MSLLILVIPYVGLGNGNSPRSDNACKPAYVHGELTSHLGSDDYECSICESHSSQGQTATIAIFQSGSSVSDGPRCKPGQARLPSLLLLFANTSLMMHAQAYHLKT